MHWSSSAGPLPASQQEHTLHALLYQDPGMHSNYRYLLLLLGHLVQHHPEERACKAQQVIDSTKLSREKASRFGRCKPSLFLSTVLTFSRSCLHPWTRRDGRDQPSEPRDKVATDKRSCVIGSSASIPKYNLVVSKPQMQSCICTMLPLHYCRDALPLPTTVSALGAKSLLHGTQTQFGRRTRAEGCRQTCHSTCNLCH